MIGRPEGRPNRVTRAAVAGRLTIDLRLGGRPIGVHPRREDGEDQTPDERDVEDPRLPVPGLPLSFQRLSRRCPATRQAPRPASARPSPARTLRCGTSSGACAPPCGLRRSPGARGATVHTPRRNPGRQASPGLVQTFSNRSAGAVRFLNFNTPAGWENYMRDLAATLAVGSPDTRGDCPDRLSLRLSRCLIGAARVNRVSHQASSLEGIWGVAGPVFSLNGE
jgi:hypothetical protein